MHLDANFVGNNDLEFSALNWLINHHESKIEARRQMIDDIEIQPGQKVLDVGCGPGLWADLFLKSIGSDGKLYGIDNDRGLINYALNISKDKNVEYNVGDFLNLPFKDNYFDVVFFGNCFVYLKDQLIYLKEQLRVVKDGGKLVGKHFDNTAFLIHPVDIELQLKILLGTYRTLKESDSKAYYNNSFGQQMAGIYKDLIKGNIKTKTYSIQLTYPLTDQQKYYLKGTGLWFLEKARKHITEAEAILWRSYFEQDSDNYILDKESFYSCFLEMQTIARVKK